MSQWHYVDGHRQRQGPIEAAALLALWRSGRLGLDTLVWREGEIEWRPLERYRSELDLPAPAGSVPPPLPPMAEPARLPQGAGGAPPRAGLPGCVIALIVAAVLLVPLAGVLAVIAVPAYQGYTLRSKLAAVVSASAPLKARLASHIAEHGSCPSNGDGDFDRRASLARGNVSRVTVGEFESGLCGVELLIGGTGNDRIDDKALWLEFRPADGSWQCSSEIDDRYLPRDCRG